MCKPAIDTSPTTQNPESLARADALEREITDLCAQINAASYRLLQLIAELDDQQPWGAWGLASCAHWPVTCIGRQFPAADAAKRAVASRTPGGPLNVVITTPARPSGPCGSPQRLFGALAT